MSLHGDYDTDNIFAKILRGEIPCAKVYEDDMVLAFMDVFPQSAGHTLVIPKLPSRNLFDTDENVLSALMAAVQKVSQAVLKAMSADGIIITQYNGAPAGQTVFHLHVHIIPRYEGARLGDHAAGKMAGTDQLTQHAAQIAAHL